MRFAGAGAQWDASLGGHSREDVDRYQGFGVPARVRPAAERCGFYSFIYVYLLFFPQSQRQDFLGLFWDKSAECTAAPKSSRAATDNKQIGWYRPQNFGDEAVIGVGRMSKIAAGVMQHRNPSEGKQNGKK